MSYGSILVLLLIALLFIAPAVGAPAWVFIFILGALAFVCIVYAFMESDQPFDHNG